MCDINKEKRVTVRLQLGLHKKYFYFVTLYNQVCKSGTKKSVVTQNEEGKGLFISPFYEYSYYPKTNIVTSVKRERESSIFMTQLSSLIT